MKANQVPTAGCQLHCVCMGEWRVLAVRRTLSQECSRRHDREPDPQPVYHTAEERYYFVAEQRRERDDDQDGNRYQPSCREVAHLLGPRSQLLSCPLSAAVGALRWLSRWCWLECAYRDNLIMFDGDDDSQNDCNDRNDPAGCLGTRQFGFVRGRFLVSRLAARRGAYPDTLAPETASSS